MKTRSFWTFDREGQDALGEDRKKETNKQNSLKVLNITSRTGISI